MNGYGWIGLGDALKEAGRAYTGYKDTKRTEYLENEQLRQRQQAMDNEKDQRAAMLALERDQLKLSREAGQRAQQQLDMTEISQLENQLQRLGPGGATPSSIVERGRALGVGDRLFDTAPQGMNMAPGEQAPVSGLPDSMLISQHYNKDMRTQDQIAEAGRQASAHAMDLRQAEQGIRTSKAMEGMYNRSPGGGNSGDDHRIMLNNMEQALGRYEAQARLRRQQISDELMAGPLGKIQASRNPAAFRAQVDAEYKRLYADDEARSQQLAWEADQLRKRLLPKDLPVWPGLFENPNPTTPPPEAAAVGAALNTSPQGPRPGSLRR